MTETAALDVLKRRQLASVTFVRNYLQFHFDGPYLNGYVWPILRNGQCTLRAASPGYRDAICGLIGEVVVDVSCVPNERLSLNFADGTIVEFSLAAEDRDTPEAVMVQGEGGRIWNVW